jgi:hypothetical protein
MAKLFQLTGFGLIFAVVVYSQQPPPIQRPNEESYWWWYLTLFVLTAGLAGAIVWKIKTKKQIAENADQMVDERKRQSNMDGLSFDADAEMEWLRKNQKIVDRKRKRPKKLDLPKTNIISTQNSLNDSQNAPDLSLELETIPLPVFSFNEVSTSAAFAQLPLSNDEALISAIEQTQDEYEEDETVRDLALRILAAFKTKNSVEALSQIAIYDLSSALRSRAIGVLTEFDHESVFETILLGCADPTREVRAAAARGLTRLSFDRADAWTRLIETNEKGRLGQAARAAIEGGFVERSFDRLVHRDPKYAYEAFVLVSLIVKSGETDKIFEALKNSSDPKVRSALLHVIKVSRDNNALSQLYGLLEDKKISQNIKDEIDPVIAQMGLIVA